MKRWPKKPLGELVSLEYGKALKAEERSPNGRFPVFGSNGIVGTFNRALVSKPTIVVGRKGAIGEAHLTENGCWPIDTAFYTVLRERNTVSLRFLLLWFRSVDLKSLAITSTIPGLNRNTLYSQPVPVPPLPEQGRIVRILDEVEGLRKLRAQADRRTADLIPALFHDMFGENAKKPHDHVKLEQIAEVVSGVAKGRKFNGRQPVEVSYLRVANVQAGHLDLSEIKTIQALPEEVEELALRKGDILLTEGGDFDKLGRGAMLEQDLPNCIHQNHVFRVRVEQSKLDPVYFAKFLLTGEARGYFLGCAKRTTNLASINMTQLRALPIPLPPISLQKEFAARVTDIRAVQAEQAASHSRLDELFQSMLHRAFQGEL